MAIPYNDLIIQAVSQIGVPSGLDYDGFVSLIPAVIQKESSFNPNAVSSTGAGIGLMQVNPNIWSSVWNVTRDQLLDPGTNITIGSTILRDYINQYGITGGLGAYFAGPSGRLSSAAKSYVQKVVGYWNSFNNALRRLATPKISQGYYFTPGMEPVDYFDIDIDMVSSYLANDYSYQSEPFQLDLTGGIGSDIDWNTWITVGVLALVAWYVLGD